MERNQSTAAHCEVELDIFSGMPNPTWTLTNGEVDRFTQQLGVLPPSAARELSGNLGYRGLIVQCTQGTKKQSIRIQRGIVQISRDEATVYMTDQGRELERQLLNTGKRYLNLDILQIVEREIR